jgi:GTPase SAR1 family protein
MYSLASGVYQSYFAPPKLSILILGLDGSGKTALLERVKVTDISTRIDVVSSSASATTTATSTSNGNDHDGGEERKVVTGAVAGVGVDAVMGRSVSGGSTNDTSNWGKPARLPPPLPPKKAMESRQFVDNALAEEAKQVMNNGSGGGKNKIDNQVKDIHGMVPPPPFALDGDESMSTISSNGGGPSDATKSTLTANSSNSQQQPSTGVIPPLPKYPSSEQQQQQKQPTTTRSSFIQLLRCPSPQRYSSSALGEDDEEYHDAIHDSALAAISTPSTLPLLSDQTRSTDEEWNTDYLQNYYINYHENEEFDTLKKGKKKMFPLSKIRPTLGQNLAKLDLCGCKCSLFDLSGAEKMRPLWERYYRDTDAIIYVVNSADPSLSNLEQSLIEFNQMCRNEVLQWKLSRGLPILIFANMLDVAYQEYDAIIERSNRCDENVSTRRGISWNADEEDNFVGSGNQTQQTGKDGEGKDAFDDDADVSKRALDFHDLVRYFGLKPQTLDATNSNHQNKASNINYQIHNRGNVFLFGGSAKSGEGVRAAMEYLVAHSKKYHLANNANEK